MAKQLLERRSISLTIREVWIKSTMRCPSIPTSYYQNNRNKTGVGEDVEPRDPLSPAAGGNIKWCNPGQKSTAVPQTITHRVSIRSSNSNSGYTLKRSASRDTNRYFACPHSRRAEGGNVSACCWVNGETWDNIQPRKGVKADTGCNTGDPEDPAQSKGDTRGQPQHDPTGRRRPEQSDSVGVVRHRGWAHATEPHT